MTSLADTSTLDALDDLLLVVDETGTLLEWNAALSDVTGASESQLATATLPDLVADGDSDAVADAIAAAVNTGEATVDATLVDADSARCRYEFKLHRRAGDDSDGGNARLVAVGRETSRQGLPESERREILDRMADAFFAVDEGWRVTYVNEGGRAILGAAMGRDPDEGDIEGLHLWEEIPDAVDTVFYEKYHEAIRTQEPVTFEEHYEPLDTWLDVRAYPSETGLSVYFYDVTDRHQQRAALEKRERVLREMYDVIADRDRSFEEQVSALLALGRDELDTRYGSLSEIRGEDYVFEIVDADDDSIEPGDVVPLSATNCEIAATSEQTLVLGDVARDAPEETDRAGYTEWGIACYIGAPVYVENDVYGTFCFYGTEPRDGQFSEWEVTLVDLMSRWVSYELQRQRANDRLRRQNERLDRFASIVSHDLRNPLNALGGWLELAEETGDAEHFERCHESIDRMYELIEDLLSLARAGDDIEEPVDVSLPRLLEECWESIAASDATLQVETDRTLRADEQRLRQLVENLLRNAVEHGSTSPDSHARQDAVEHGSTSPPSQAPEDAVEHGGSVTVTVGDLPDGFYVADDGPGIPEADRDEVFESGYTTAAEGTGFGLAIVADIANAHGWDVTVTESEAGGARFEFTGVSS